MNTNELRIMNAAGWCKDIATVQKLLRTPITEVTVGSITLKKRTGNEGTVFWESPDGSYALNSLGLPNPGLDTFLTILPEMRAVTHDTGKGLRVSIAGFDPDEYSVLVWGIHPFVDTLEFNFGCPNVWGSDGQKVIASNEPELMENILTTAVGKLDSKLARPRLAIKLSMYSDPRMIGSIIKMLSGALRNEIQEVVTCNTFPNGYGFDARGKPAITPACGFAGLSGPALKGIALGQVCMFANGLQHLGIDVIGVGGISSGEDIRNMYRAGASGVQIGTHYFSHGEKIFQEVMSEYVHLE